jgi:magnesium chelatase subunit I
MRAVFPFSAIVGQEEMKMALMIAAADPGIGGVLVFGDRGTGKSTAVRALAALLPDMPIVPGCRYNCAPERSVEACPQSCEFHGLKPAKLPAAKKMQVPVVDLPLGATEDRVMGALDIERALSRGEKAFEPGLLARANRGFLYIDEVNLLEDHLVDVLLDVAASGENVVEREGLSIRHPARFVLIGSGNPEEGELRPQLLDRFGLSVDVGTPGDVKSRIEVIRRRDEFERNPEAFVKKWSRKDAALRRQIVKARDALGDIDVPDEVLEKASELCLALGTDGLRGELTIIRTSRAAAALAGDKTVTLKHLKSTAAPALRHRLRRNPLDDAGSGVRVDRAMAEVLG